MKALDNSVNLHTQQIDKSEQNDTEGYPLYPENEDIYNKLKKSRIIDPDDITSFKVYEKTGKNNVKDFEEDFSGNDLDIPGAELENENLIIGSEDEENNYYSLGGDDHLDLEENLA